MNNLKKKRIKRGQTIHKDLMIVKHRTANVLITHFQIANNRQVLMK